jgi:hypothetical protein
MSAWTLEALAERGIKVAEHPLERPKIDSQSGRSVRAPSPATARADGSACNALRRAGGSAALQCPSATTGLPISPGGFGGGTDNAARQGASTQGVGSPHFTREAFRQDLLELAPDLPSISGLRLKDEDRLQAELVARVWAGVRHEGWALGIWSVQNTVPVFRRRLPGGKPDPDDRAPIVAGARLKAMGLLRGVFDLCAIWWAGEDEAAGIGFLETKLLKGSQQHRIAEDRGRLKGKPPLAAKRSLLRPEQRVFLRLLQIGGIPGAPYWSLDEGLERLKRWGAISSTIRDETNG